MRKIHQIMNHLPEVIVPDADLVKAASVMSELKIGTLLVAKGNPKVLRPDDLLGIVTDRDIIVRCIAKGMDPEIFTVSQAMTTPVFYCLDNDDLTAAVKIMEDRGVRRLAVFSSVTRQLIGLLSLDDIAEESRKELAGGILYETSRRKKSA